MYRGFRLDSDIVINEAFVQQTDASSSPDIKAVEAMIMSGQPIDSAEVANCLFPQGSPDVFLSHSFQDRNVALKLAVMNTSRISVFTDFAVWSLIYNPVSKARNLYLLRV